MSLKKLWQKVSVRLFYYLHQIIVRTFVTSDVKLFIIKFHPELSDSEVSKDIRIKIKENLNKELKYPSILRCRSTQDESKKTTFLDRQRHMLQKLPWQVAPFKIGIILLLFITQYATCAPKITIMLDPAGDAHNPGRIIGNNVQPENPSSVTTQGVNAHGVSTHGVFERTCTLFFARELKKALEKKDKNIMVLFTRLPGEHTSQIEKARFANQCNVDLFCHISAASSSNIKPQLHLYHATPSPFAISKDTLFIPLQHAHDTSHKKTTIFADTFFEQLNTHSRTCDTHKPVTCALTPLNGITSPALCIEFGIKQVDDLSHLIAPLADALYTSLKELS